MNNPDPEHTALRLMAAQDAVIAARRAEVHARMAWRAAGRPQIDGAPSEPANTCSIYRCRKQATGTIRMKGPGGATAYVPVCDQHYVDSPKGGS